MLSLNLAISPLSWWRNWFGVAGVVLARWCGDVPQWCRNILCRSWPCLFCKLGHLKSSTRSNRAPGCCRAYNDPLQGRLNPDKSHIIPSLGQPPLSLHAPPHSTSKHLRGRRKWDPSPLTDIVIFLRLLPSWKCQGVWQLDAHCSQPPSWLQPVSGRRQAGTRGMT